MAKLKILLALVLFVSFIASPTLAWWNSSWQTRYNVTLDLVNTSRRTTDIFWNFTALGVTAANCTKEIRLTTDTDVEIPSWSYSQEANGTNKNCVVAALVNQTSKTKSYWLYSNNPNADVSAYPNPFTIYGGVGLGTSTGSIDNGAGFNVTWGTYGTGGGVFSGFIPKINKINLFSYIYSVDGNHALLFQLPPTVWPGFVCNITLSTPIFNEISCWRTSGTSNGYLRTYVYRNQPTFDLVYFQTGTAETWLGADTASYTPAIGVTNKVAHDASTAYDTPQYGGDPQPHSYAGLVTIDAGYHYYNTIFSDYVWPGASGEYMTFCVGGETGNTCDGPRRKINPLGAPAGGYKARFISINDTGNGRANVQNFYLAANVENTTYWVPLATSINGLPESGNSASVSVQNSTGTLDAPIEIGQDVTIQLNYTYTSNSSPVTSALTNLTVFDTTADRNVISFNNVLTFVLSLGSWQFNFTTPLGANGTYKYNVLAAINGTPDSSVDVNGTFDTKDTTSPQISGLGVATSSCSGYSNYRFANSPFEVTFSATDNWQVNPNSSFCNFTMSNYTSVISQMANGNNCSFPSAGPAGSATLGILVNDTANNTASATLGMTVVDSCPVQPTPSPSTSSGGSGGGGGGGGSGGSLVSTTINEGGLPEIIFESRALSMVQYHPEKLKIRLKNPKNVPLRVTLEGPPEISFDEKNFTLLAGGEKEVYATLSYLTAGEYKPIISAQLGDLKRMYDLSVTVVKREADAVEQLLIDAQKAVNSLILLKYKACENDVNAVKSKAIAIETLAGDIRSAYLLSKGTMPSAAKIEELKKELSAITDFTAKIGECKPTTIQQKSATTSAETEVQKPKKAGILMPAMIIMALLFGAGLFRFLRKA